MTLFFDNGASLEAEALAFAMTSAPEGIAEMMLDRMDGGGVLDHENYAMSFFMQPQSAVTGMRSDHSLRSMGVSKLLSMRQPRSI
jgi:hypothetical protein